MLELRWKFSRGTLGEQDASSKWIRNFHFFAYILDASYILHLSSSKVYKKPYFLQFRCSLYIASHCGRGAEIHPSFLASEKERQRLFRDSICKEHIKCKKRSTKFLSTSRSI
jgi:hypothetical protein